MPIKVITSPQHHLWTDALHGRALARSARNDWDRGTYVRWTIMSAWTAFEAICADVLAATGLGNRFRDGFDKALEAKSLADVDWGTGLWQRVNKVYATRKEFTHASASAAIRLKTPAIEAENAISVLREAIIAVHVLASVPPPKWANDDEDRGWDAPTGTFGALTAIKAGADPSDPMTVRIVYVLNGKEFESSIEPAGTDHGPLFDELISALNVPVTAIRAYHGSTMIDERLVNARGN